MESKEEEVTSDLLKDQGNKAVKESKFDEAVLHYTYAIKLDPQNYTLYSNRSFAYLKLKHYYLALSDAKETISLNPSWPKGYFRKGEVEFTTGHYSDAYESYREALKWKPDDTNILEAVNKSAKRVLKQQKTDKEIPWVGAGIGIIIGAFMQIADFVATRNPTHPLLMAFITIGISIIGYGIARSYRAYTKHQRNSLLEPPPDLEQDSSQEEEEKEEIRRTPRYTRSQARLRYKKGKA